MQEKDKNINRIKAVLAEKNKTSKWLAGQLIKIRRQFQSGVQTLINLV